MSETVFRENPYTEGSHRKLPFKKPLLLGLAAVLLSGTAAGAAVFEDVVVRQMWPWDRNVVVECVARGVDRPVQVNLGLTADGQAIGGVPAAAYRSPRAFIRGGKIQVEFDPRAVPGLAALGDVTNLQVDLSAEEVPADDVLYVIFDLEKKGSRPEIVTTDALTNGVWGAWEDAIWTDSKLTPTGKPVWTGVTNDTKYALTHLVMRRIPAGTFPMGYKALADKGKEVPNISQRDVTITKPYYIGVYTMTKKQNRLLTGSTGTSNPNYPSVDNSYDAIRGAYTTAGGAYDWPNDKTVDPDSLIGKLRAATGVDFDLPTEAQWEKAARAGSAGIYYDGTETTTKSVRNAIAWWTENAGNAAQPVGRLKANNYGLYDTLGNVYEWVLDWQAGAVDISSTDPEGPTAAGADYWTGGAVGSGSPKRMMKGGDYLQYSAGILLFIRSQNRTDEGKPNYGWRVAMPASEIDGGENMSDAAEGVTVDVTPTWSWTTMRANDGIVRWVWPSEAKSARLVVSGVSKVIDQVLVPPTDSYDLGLSVPTRSRDEQALAVRLTFFKGSDVSGDVVGDLVAKGLGDLCAAPAVAVSDDSFRKHVGKRVVLPVPSGTDSLSIDGQVMETTDAPCWFGWLGTYGAHTLQLNDSGEVPVELCPLGFAVLIR